MKINYFTYLITVFFRKSCRASKIFKFPNKVKLFIFRFYYHIIWHLLYPYFSKVYRILNNPSFKGLCTNNKKIWVFWWQGKDKMPLVAKKCIESIILHSSGHDVVFVSKYNVKKLTDIPNYIYYKLNKGILDYTHFSDVVRFNILERYGGVWIDATMYCASDLDQSYFNHYLYTSGGYHGTYPLFVEGKWVEGLIGGNVNNSVFQFMDMFNKLYWKHNNVLINYFMEDYALKYIYIKNIGGFTSYVNKIACNHNPYLFKFVNLLNRPFNEVRYKQILRHTNLFNLTYKRRFCNKKNTFYHKLMNK